MWLKYPWRQQFSQIYWAWTGTFSNSSSLWESQITTFLSDAIACASEVTPAGEASIAATLLLENPAYPCSSKGGTGNIECGSIWSAIKKAGKGQKRGWEFEGLVPTKIWSQQNKSQSYYGCVIVIGKSRYLPIPDGHHWGRPPNRYSSKTSPRLSLLLSRNS